MRANIHLAFIAIFIFAWLNPVHSQCVSNNAIYVTPGGTGTGTAASPTSITTALTLFANDTTRPIYLGSGDYTIYKTLKLASGMHIEGGFTVNGSNWTKTEATTNLNVIANYKISKVEDLGDTFTVASIIGIELDTVKDIMLKDFNLYVSANNYDIYTYESALENTRDGYSVYAIYAQYSSNVEMLNMTLSPDNAGGGGPGIRGQDGIDAYYMQGGGEEVDTPNTHDATRPEFKLLPGEPYQAAGGAGGWGGLVQGYWPCQDPSCLTSGCEYQEPAPAGHPGGSSFGATGGAGGACGAACEWACWYQAYVDDVGLSDTALVYLIAGGQVPNVPQLTQVPTAGTNGQDGAPGAPATNPGIAREGDQFFIPGTGQTGVPGSGGSGGGGGGAGGIMTLAIPQFPPGVSGLINAAAETADAGLSAAQVTLLAIVNSAAAAGQNFCPILIENVSGVGGNGGGGGSGGGPGNGGGGGGSVYGIYGYLCNNIIPGNITYNLGSAGTGGNGGFGGSGGAGALGYPGPPVSNGLTQSFRGATGGNGGNGGDGGFGQPGADGKQYQTWGINDNNYFGLTFAYDSLHICTNSIITFFKNPESYLQVFGANGYGIQAIVDSPTYDEYSVSTAQTLFVNQGNVHAWNVFAEYYIPVTAVRAPANFYLPPTVCPYDTLKLTAADTTQQAYQWTVALNNGTVVARSTAKKWSFIPANYNTSASAIYTVSLQEYSTCCGWSTILSQNLTIEQPLQLTFAESGNIPPYCAGQGIYTKLTVSGDNGVTSGFPYITTYPGLVWNTGDSGVNMIHVDTDGIYSVTYTSPAGCITHSPNYGIGNIFPQLPGAPITQSYIACPNTTLQLRATYPGAWSFNYYTDSTTQFTIGGGYQTPFVNWTTNFPPFSNQQDSNIIWAAAVNQYGCASSARGKVVVKRFPSGIGVVPPFTSYYQAISSPTACGAGVNYQVPTGADYCGDYVWATLVSGYPSGALFPAGTNTVIYRLKNLYGDSTDVPITIDIYDTTPPLISVAPDVHINNTPGQCSALIHLAPPYGTDNCQSIITPSEYWSGLDVGDTVFGVGTTKITYVFTDPSYNTTIGHTTVTITDNEPPTLTCPANQVYYVHAGDTVAYVGYNAPSVSDNCGGLLGAKIPWEVSGFPQFGWHSIGITNQIWADTDAAGNYGTCQFIIQVKDTIAPALTCPGPFYFLADTGLDYTHISYGQPTAIDVLGGPVTYSLLSGKASGDTASIGLYTAVWQGTDVYGNTGTCPVKITVASNQAPNLICPHNIVSQNDSGLCTAKIDYTVAPALDVDGHYYSPILYFGLDSGAAFPFGVTNVVYTALDLEGNRAFCSFTVTVSDNIAPVFTSPCPNDTTLNLNPAVCGAQLSPPVLTGISYDCNPPSIGIWSGVSNHFFTLGTTTQQYRIIDDHGNYNICQYRVTVVDNNNPTVSCPSDITVNNDPGKCTAYLPNIGTPTLTPFYDQGCVSASITAPLAPNFPTFLIGTTQVRYSAYVNGYSLGCTWNVTVVNTENPHIVSPANIVQTVNPGACGNVINFTAPVGTDTCANGVSTFLVNGLAPGSLFPVGTTQETYVVADLQGNTDTANFTITVLDTVKPGLTNPGNIIDSTSTMCGMNMNFNRPVGTDNSGCFVTYLVAGLDSGAQFPLGTTHEIWVVRDSSGNTDTVAFNVTVKPIYPLNAGCIDNWPLSDPNGNGQIIYYPVPGTTDQYTGQPYPCPGVSIHLISGIGSGGFFTPGPHNEVYQFIATGTGDTVSCTTVVIDAPIYSYPNLNCGTQQIYNYPVDTGTCKGVAPIPQLTASEGNIPVTVTYTIDGVASTDSIDTFSPGYHSIQYTATDYFGGQATCNIDIIIGTNITVSPNFLTQGRATYCQNESVTLNPNLGGILTGATYQWITLDSLSNYYTYSTDSALHFSSIQPSNANQYHFIATDQCGSVASIGEFTLQVKAAPVTTLSGLDTAYCVYDSSNYTVSVSPAGGILTGDGLTGNLFNPKKAGLGTHSIVYTYNDAVSGCTGVSIIVVTVHGLPTVSPFADSLYCINSVPIQLPATNSTYSGAGISGTVFTPAIAGGGYHVITRTVTAYGCSSQLSQNIHVNATIPNATITAPASVCLQTATHALSTATTGGTWSGNYLLIDSLGNAQLNTLGVNTGPDQIIYTVTKNACSSADTVVVNIRDNSDTLPYTLPQYCITSPPVAFDTTDGKKYFGLGFNNNIFTPGGVGVAGLVLYSVITVNSYGCVDTNMRMISVLGGALDIFRWQFVCPPGDSLFVNLGNAYDSIHWSFGSSSSQLWFADTGSYPVFLRDTGGCYGYDTLHILQYPAPAEIVHATSVYACPQDSVTIMADSSFTHYSWSNGDTTQTINAMPGSYVVTVTQYGCNWVSPPVVVTTGPDTVPPSITCPPDTLFYTPAGSCSISPLGLGVPIALDNCGLASVTSNAPSSFTVGITNVTWTAIDHANNHAACVQHVTVRDSIKPFFTGTPSGGFIMDTTPHACSNSLPDFTGLFTASDSCSSITMTQVPAPGTPVTTAITPVAITATDVSGNTVSYYLIFQTNDTVNSAVTPTVLVSAEQNSICAGTGDTISAAITNGGSSPVYLWLLNNQPLNVSGSAFATDSLKSTDVIKCVLISNAACATPDTVASGSLSVTVKPIPNAVVSPAGPVSICQGDSSQLSGPAGGDTYLWSTHATTQSISVETGGNYTVTVTSSNNCTAVSSPVNVTVNPLPGVPTITQQHDTLTSSAASTYQWYLNDTLITNGTGRSIVITRPGNYTVEVTDNSNCSNVSAVQHAITLSVSNLSSGYEVQLYPNPNNGNFTLQFSDNQVRYVWLTDVTGRNITNAEAVSGHKDFYVSALSSGVYMLEIMDENGLQTLRVVINK